MATVLVVDDDAVHRQILRLALEKDGLEVVTGEDGAAGVRLAQEHKPDAVLLDVVMPEMDGVAACQALKQDPDTKDIPVIMLTAVVTPEHIERATAAGAVDYVVKPFDPQTVTDTVRKWID